MKTRKSIRAVLALALAVMLVSGSLPTALSYSMDGSVVTLPDGGTYYVYNYIHEGDFDIYYVNSEGTRLTTSATDSTFGVSIRRVQSGYFRDSAGYMYIPDTIRGYPVVRMEKADDRNHYLGIRIPASVTEIVDPTFSNCPYLEWIEVAESNPDFFSADGVLYKIDAQTGLAHLVCYPARKTDESFTTDPRAQYIDNKAFDGNACLKTLTIAAGAAGVNVGLIRNCSALETLILGEGPIGLRYAWIENCPALTTVHFSASYLLDYEEDYGQGPVLRNLSASGAETLTVCCCDYNAILQSAAENSGYGFRVCGGEHYYPQQDAGTTGGEPIPDGYNFTDESLFWFSPYYQKDANGESVKIGYTVQGATERIKYPVRVSIPAYHGGLPVLEIGSIFSTFENAIALRIPETVQSIPYSLNADTLESIDVDENSAYFKAVDGVLYTADGKELIAYPPAKKDASFTIPDGTERLANTLLRWSPDLRQINVPPTFTDGRIAETLDTANTLERVCVDAGNPALFADEAGVLYNKTQSTLLFCPPHGPADYTLPPCVTQIADRSLCGGTLRIADGAAATPIVNLSTCFYRTEDVLCLHVPESVTTVRFSGGSSSVKICCPTRASQAAAFAEANDIPFYICSADHAELRLPTDDDPPAPALLTDQIFDFYFISETDESGAAQFTGVGIQGMLQTPDEPFVLTVPAEYAGLPVREVDFAPTWANTHGAKVTRIELPATVQTVAGISDRGTLYTNECFSSLSAITADDANPYLCAVDGVLFDKAMTTLILYPAAKTDASYAIPDGVVTVADGYVFSENRHMQRLTIPASFTGDTSYARCFNAVRLLRKLQRFTVDPQNPVFAADDAGALLSADRQTLMLYPSAATAELYTIPASVTKILSEFTFHQPEHLRVICVAEGVTSTPTGFIGTTTPYLHIPSSVQKVNFTGGSPRYQTVCSDTVDCAAAAYAAQRGMPFALCSADHTQFTIVDLENYPELLRFAFRYITEQDDDGVTQYTGVCIEGLTSVPDAPYTLTIPETYRGLPVREVDFLFWTQAEEQGVVRIELPKTVQTLQGFPMGTPRQCTNLESIAVDAENPYFCAVDGVLFDKDMTTLIWYPAAKTDADYAIPEGVLKPDNSDSFSANGYLRHLSIPASFTEWGTAVNTCFSGLPNLERFYVAADNPEYSSDDCGVLYNKNKTILFIYPCAAPAQTFTIPASVTRFGFYGQACAPRNLRVLCIADGATRTPNSSRLRLDDLQYLHIPSGVGTIVVSFVRNTGSSFTICSDREDSAAARFAQNYGYAFALCEGHGTSIPDDPPAPTEPLALTVSGGTAKPGDIVRVTVDLTKNAGVVALRMHLRYDPDVLTLTGVQDGGLFETAAFVPGRDLSAVPFTVLWEDALTRENCTATGTLVTYTFRVSETAEAGTTPVTLTYDANSTYNVDLQNVACAITNGSVTVSTRFAGDANGDGVLDLKDVVLLRRFLAGGWNVTIEADNMDVDGDGVLSLKDSTLLSRYLAGGWNVTLK